MDAVIPASPNELKSSGQTWELINPNNILGKQYSYALYFFCIEVSSTLASIAVTMD